MKDFLLYPFKMALREMDTNKQIKEELAQSDIKVGTLPGFVMMNYMFFFIYVILYMSIIYLIFASFFEPALFLALAMNLLFTWFMVSLHKHLYPKTRKNYLKSIGYYEKNK